MERLEVWYGRADGPPTTDAASDEKTDLVLALGVCAMSRAKTLTKAPADWAVCGSSHHAGSRDGTPETSEGLLGTASAGLQRGRGY